MLALLVSTASCAAVNRLMNAWVMRTVLRVVAPSHAACATPNAEAGPPKAVTSVAAGIVLPIFLNRQDNPE